ncbi:esterase-like activity of phytase family protein [Nostoc sp. FACHB-152]|uniref:esterase-like activity of phytase family protein n=1 Tax=unclassified Nostoc TaxID=2593658 RepID=UPI001682C3F9|nr:MULTISPECIES: esterase-like activity of phytase family protein [unclassified Nostoc]MBD2447819.1 esterase-like activity of phytase family protein [Nostoc sp. FACHB-152]MBD2468607.1 esterase-like activity of phytase family protein [Nostoc sp. FACHB-145]
MVSAKHWISGLSFSLITAVVSITGLANPASAISLVNGLTVPGNSTDLSLSSSNSANTNRLGFFSDLYYDRYSNVYYSLADRGPGGGVIDYKTRVHKFSLDVDQNTGAISNLKLIDTILFTQNGQNFNGLNPGKLNGDASNLGLSFDPEGFAIAPNGNFYISDEYGPSVYEFSATGSFIRAFSTPSNLIPKQSDGTVNYVDGRPDITTGRQDNRGFEGVTLSPDGSKLFAMLQDALVNEGSPDGRRSPNLRIVEFDTKTSESTAQYIYQLESLADINARVPEDSFGANSQGRNIGISAITALNDKEFLVLERDNRGVGVEDPTGETPVASKRIYKIDLTSATDVTDISLTGTNTLPAGVTSVSKTLFADIADFLKKAGKPIPEKFEGLAIGPKLADGSYALIVGTDNDFSVTQNDDDVQFDVCSDGTQVAIDSGCPNGATLIPTFVYALKASKAELAGFVPPAKVPEPTTTAGIVLLASSVFFLKRLKVTGYR